MACIISIDTSSHGTATQTVVAEWTPVVESLGEPVLSPYFPWHDDIEGLGGMLIV